MLAGLGPRLAVDAVAGLLTAHVLPPDAVRACLSRAEAGPPRAPRPLYALLAVLADNWATSGAQAPDRQACLTLGVAAGLALADRQGLERAGLGGAGEAAARGLGDGLIPVLLSGISTHLGSPLLEVRRRGMRVGHALSAVLDPGAPPLFAEELATGPGRAPEEEAYWIGDARQPGAVVAVAATVRPAARAPPPMPVQPDLDDPEAGLEPVTDTDSDDEPSDAGFEPYDLAESDEEGEGCAGWFVGFFAPPGKQGWEVKSTAEACTNRGAGPTAAGGGDLPTCQPPSARTHPPPPAEEELRKMTVRGIITGLTKMESDWKVALRSLRAAVRVAKLKPDELPHSAGAADLGLGDVVQVAPRLVARGAKGVCRACCLTPATVVRCRQAGQSPAACEGAQLGGRGDA